MHFTFLIQLNTYLIDLKAFIHKNELSYLKRLSVILHSLICVKDGRIMSISVAKLSTGDHSGYVEDKFRFRWSRFRL